MSPQPLFLSFFSLLSSRAAILYLYREQRNFLHKCAQICFYGVLLEKISPKKQIIPWSYRKVMGPYLSSGHAMYVCVDFDGTIVDHLFPELGAPAPGAIKWLKRFAELDAKIILFTMRSDNMSYGNLLSEAVQYLQHEGITLFGINHNPAQDSWTSSPKAYANVYIDDAAVGCPTIHPRGFARACVNWNMVGPYVESMLLQSR